MRWALLVAAAAAAPDLSKCTKKPPPAVEGCAAEWAALRKSRPAPARRVVVSFLFRDMAPARLVQFVEYYLDSGTRELQALESYSHQWCLTRSIERRPSAEGNAHAVAC